MHIPHSNKFYRLIEKILKILVLFFKNTKNKKLTKAALAAIYRAHTKEQFLLKNNKSEDFIVHCDEIISKEIFLEGSFDFFKLEEVISIIKKNNQLTTLVDIGANIGPIAIPALTKNYFKEAILIEPDEKNFQVLMANIYLNGLRKRVTPYNIALTDIDNSSLYLEINEGNNYGDHRIFDSLVREGVAPSEKNIRSIRGETLDKIAPHLERNNSLIWMDTQGHEGIILKGAKLSIKKQIPIVLEFTPSFIEANGSYDCFKLLLGYSFVYDLNEAKPIPVEFNEIVLKNLFDKYHKHPLHFYTDLLFI
jgi:FkbM family methyltransferase